MPSKSSMLLNEGQNRIMHTTSTPLNLKLSQLDKSRETQHSQISSIKGINAGETMYWFKDQRTHMVWCRWS